MASIADDPFSSSESRGSLTPTDVSTSDDAGCHHHQASQLANSLAIIGWAHKFPGDANTSESFWNMLCEARTAHGYIPRDRFNIDAFYHPDHERTGSMNVKHAHFLRQQIGAFDAPFFSIQENEAATMDPQQRLLLETAYHALENACIPIESVKGSNTSVHIGSSSHDYESIYTRDPETGPQYLGTGIGGSILANRLSWFFDLHGESMLIDTACSSSLTSLHLASQALKAGNADMSLVGGVNLVITPDSSFFHLSRMGFFSPDGRSYSFDDRGNGYAKGEGAAIMVVKRLSDAVRDGDTIRAVIRATGINQDGRTPGITQPSEQAQISNISTTHIQNDIDPNVIQYIEAHGTGTQVGDPIEIAAIAKAFDRDVQNPLYVGAVKPNIGHLEAVAGLAGLIKTVLVLEKGLIPPNALYASPNPKIDLAMWNIKFAQEVTLWPRKGLRRAAVNSFGYGGTNGYVVLDDAHHFLEHHNINGKHNSVEDPSSVQTKSSDILKNHLKDPGHIQEPLAPWVFVWSAADKAAVKRMTDWYKEYVSCIQLSGSRENDFLRNLAYTLGSKRSALPWKTFVIANSIQALNVALYSKTSEPVRSSGPAALVFVFTGQGAQWPAMGRELVQYPIFKESLEHAEQVLKELSCQLSPIDEMSKEGFESSIGEPLMSQTLCTILQLAFVDLLASVSLLPSAVIGHSSGEIAAAYCAGGLSFESAVKAAYYRGLYASSLVRKQSRDGAMLSVSLSPQGVTQHIADAMTACDGMVVVACENSASNVTLSGDKTCIEYLNRMMEQKGVFARQLQVPVAYHSPHMQEVADAYRQSLAGITTKNPGRKPNNHDIVPVMFSTVTGGQIGITSLADPGYWVTNLTSTVKFSTGMKNLVQFLRINGQSGQSGQNSHRVHILELGPHSALKRPVKDVLATISGAENSTYDSIMERNLSARDTFLQAIGKMWCIGLSVDLNGVNTLLTHPGDVKQLVDLPQYPFNHSQSYWAESRISRNYRFRPVPRHDLLGAPSNDWNSLEPHWRHHLKASENPWIQDHYMDSANIYPAAGMIAMVIEAARQLAGSSPRISAYHMTNIQFTQALKVNNSREGVEVQLRFHRPQGIGGSPSNEHDFTLFMFSDDRWTQCCNGTITIQVDGTTSNPLSLCVENHKLIKEQFKGGSFAYVCTESVSKKDFYDNMSKYGCEFGPMHQVLEDIRYSEEVRDACAEIVLDSWVLKSGMSRNSISPYVIHPTDLDGVAQLSIAAFSKGGTRPFPTMVPTNCKSLWISNDLLTRVPGDKLSAFVRNTFVGFREADSTIVACGKHGEPLIMIEDWRQMAVTNLQSFYSTDSDVKRLCYTTEWVQDVEQMSENDIRCLCEEGTRAEDSNAFDVDALELMSMYYASRIIDFTITNEVSHSPVSHIQQYLDWAERVYDENRLQELMLSVPGGHSLTEGDTSRDAFLNLLASHNVECQLTMHVGQNLTKVLQGKVNPLEIVYDPDLIRDFYQGPSFKHSFDQINNYIGLLAHKNPNLRVLEIGAGTASATVSILSALGAPQDGDSTELPRFERYDFTDLSTQYFEHAEKLIGSHSGRFCFKLLDIEKDPTLQGFAEGAYDVVLASLVLHATSDISKSLRNARKLLRPGGQLILLELTNLTCARYHLIFGLLPGWWLGVEESRRSGPLLTTHDWDEALRHNDFSGADIIISDTHIQNQGTFSVMVATAKELDADITSETASPLIVVNPNSSSQRDVAEQLANCLNIVESVEILHIDQITTGECSKRHCIVLVELDRSWLSTISESDFRKLQTLLKDTNSILWVTSGTASAAIHPDRDLATGLGRNVRSENWMIKFTHLGLDKLTDPTLIAKHIKSIYTKNLITSVEKCEDVYWVQNGSYYVGRVSEAAKLNRLMYSKTVKQRPQRTSFKAQSHRVLALSIGAPGLLDTMLFVDDDGADVPLEDTEVEVHAAAVGLNFRDVLIALGKMSSGTLGYEFSGTVSRAGKDANFSPGDRVFGITTSGAFKTKIRAEAHTICKMQDSLSFEEAAAIPLAWATAYYCLVVKANLQSNESVLIHSAAGGVGQAAVQIARHIGAEIFVTVGTDEKKQFMVGEYDIPQSHVFSSRSGMFAESVMQLTTGRGVDVVLNSLSGNLMRASWSVVAPLGRFVEIGKTDIMSGRGLEMRQFLKNISFISVDLVVVVQNSVSIMNKVMAAIVNLYRMGTLKIAKPLRVFNVGELEAAFRWMQGGKNIGKAVVTFDRSSSIMASPDQKPKWAFRDDATYVVAGGFGGIGRTIVKWMASNGARSFLIPSRSGDKSTAAQKLITELAAKNVTVVGLACDIAQEAAVESMIRKAERRGMTPIKGCIQATMVLQDGLFQNLTHSSWIDSLRPKVMGSWNLHTHLPKGMDFFVTMSSIASLIGSRGQANYAAGNAYKDSLVRHRLAQGESAFTLNIGPVKSVGLVAEAGNEHELLRDGFEAIEIEELLVLLEHACSPDVGRGPGHDPGVHNDHNVITGLGGIRNAKAKAKNEIYWLQRPFLSRLNNYYSEKRDATDSSAASADSNTTQTDILLKRHASSDIAAVTVVLEALQLKLSRSLNVPLGDVDASKPISAFGVDSLVSLEIRYWFMKEARANLPVFDIMSAASLHALATLAWSKSSYRLTTS